MGKQDEVADGEGKVGTEPAMAPTCVAGSAVRELESGLSTA